MLGRLSDTPQVEKDACTGRVLPAHAPGTDGAGDGPGIVVAGTSLGGLRALQTVLALLPTSFPLPVVIVQHRGAASGELLLTALQSHCALPVEEPHDKEDIASGRVYVAPPDYHLLVDGRCFALSTEGPVSYARPSIDVLFESAAESYGHRVIAVVMTGASRDGARGAALVKAQGGTVLVQEPSTAESAVMPQAALAAADADGVLTLAQIGAFLFRLGNR